MYVCMPFTYPPLGLGEHGVQHLLALSFTPDQVDPDVWVAGAEDVLLGQVVA